MVGTVVIGLLLAAIHATGVAHRDGSWSWSWGMAAAWVIGLAVVGEALHYAMGTDTALLRALFPGAIQKRCQ